MENHYEKMLMIRDKVQRALAYNQITFIISPKETCDYRFIIKIHDKFIFLYGEPQGIDSIDGKLVIKTLFYELSFEDAIELRNEWVSAGGFIQVNPLYIYPFVNQ